MESDSHVILVSLILSIHFPHVTKISQLRDVTSFLAVVNYFTVASLSICRCLVVFPNIFYTIFDGNFFFVQMYSDFMGDFKARRTITYM